MNTITFDALGIETISPFDEGDVGVTLGPIYSRRKISLLRAAYAPKSDLITGAIEVSVADAAELGSMAEEIGVEALSEARLELTRHILKLADSAKWDDRASEQRASAAIKESLIFLSLFPLEVSAPKASAAPDGVISFEWDGAGKKAIAMFEGDGEYGYAYFVDGRFHPGGQAGHLDQKVPSDLTEYLAA